jgi:Xaa-Pro aminopeptidase
MNAIFEPQVLVKRRNALRNLLNEGLVLIPGNFETAFNYAGNTYSFRQDSNFLYFFGIDVAGLFGVIDLDENCDILFAEETSVEDTVWTGPVPGIADLQALCGASKGLDKALLPEYIRKAIKSGRKIHFLKPYRCENALLLSELTGIHHSQLAEKVSMELVKAIAKLRLIKSAEEIAEMEKASAAAYQMHTGAMKIARPGILEREVASFVEGTALLAGGPVSFPVICSVRGEVLHNHYHGNVMLDGQMLLVDAGAETDKHYASDITRTFPVNGKFTAQQKAIYEIVLKANTTAIENIKPNVPYRDIHLQAATVIASGLKDLGLLKGDVNEIVAAGAQGFFFVHGIGHQLGLDVHDLEGLGEDNFAYDDEIKRSSQFGTAYLRFGRRLEPGMVLTVEPGIYFIPELFKLWKNENKFAEFINYTETEKWLGFGGIRIEDNVLVTNNGHRLMGQPIPKTVADIEALMQK